MSRTGKLTTIHRGPRPVKRRVVTIIETDDGHGMTRMVVRHEGPAHAQPGPMTVQDLERMLRNALFGMEKQYERQLAAIADGVMVGAGLEPGASIASPETNYRLQALPPALPAGVGEFQVLPEQLARRLENLSGGGHS